VSAVDFVIRDLGGPTQASWTLSKFANRPISYATIQSWRRRPRGIPLTMRQLMYMNAHELGIKNQTALLYLQPKDGIS